MSRYDDGMAVRREVLGDGLDVLGALLGALLTDRPLPIEIDLPEGEAVEVLLP